MNVCLVCAPVATTFTTREEIDSCVVEAAAPEPQLGVLSLAAVLEARGDGVRIVDLDEVYLAYLDSPNQVRPFAEVAAAHIAAEPAEVYGFSSVCSSYPLTIRIAGAVKAARPESTILFGGPQATVVDQQTLAAFPFVDLVLRGEAEMTLPLLLDELAGEGQLSRVPGLTYRRDSKPRRNCNAPIIEDLDTIPAPAYHLTGRLHGAPRASLELGRGCPFACTFCSTNDFFRRRFRLRSSARILRDMRAIANAYGIQQFELVHDMFTVDRRRVVAFCEAMLASGEGFQWSCSARTDCVDDELLELMSQSGCIQIFYGIESGSQRLQEVFDKGLDVEQAKKVVAATERFGMRSTVSLIIGFPEETEEDLRQTLRMFMCSARHAGSSPYLNILAPLAETPIHLKYRDQMTLEDVSPDMSQEGPVIDAEDLDLIERFPEIFPNFYLLPTPHLDRGRLLELREFALNAVGHFRWLLCAIDQSASEFYDVFLSWRRYRMEVQPVPNRPELRRYYNSPAFRRDFLSFVELSPMAETRAVRALLEFETAWLAASGSSANSPLLPEAVSGGEPICDSDVPFRRPGIRLFRLLCDIQNVIDGLKCGAQPVWEEGPHYYVTLESTDALKTLYGVSLELGRVLETCDGQHTVQEIVELQAGEFADVAASYREAAVRGLIEAAAKEGLLSVSPTLLNHPGEDREAPSICTSLWSGTRSD